MNDKETTPMTQTINNVLDQWKDTQFNIASESARYLLSLAIAERVDEHVKQLIEDIVCPTWSDAPPMTCKPDDTDYQIYNQTN